MSYIEFDVGLVANAYHRTTSRACSDLRECPGVPECVYAEHLDWDGFRAGVAALVAAGWRPRAAVAEEIADALDEQLKHGAPAMSPAYHSGYRDAARYVRNRGAEAGRG